MTQLFKCDRCKEIFGENDITRGMITGFWSNDQTKDLCDSCKDDLDSFLFGCDLIDLEEESKK